MTNLRRYGYMDGRIVASGDYLLWIFTKASGALDAKNVVYSPYFEFVGRIWGLEASSARNWLLLTLKNYNEGEASDLVMLGVKVDDKYSLRNAAPDESGRNFTVSKVVQCEELHDSNTQLLPDGVLTVVCKIAVQERSDEKYAKEQFKQRSIAKLQRDFQQMLDSGRYSDVVLSVGERYFKAHRNILSARSRVFSRMFSHKMREKITGLVKIEDTNQDVFSDFLHYLYTGSVDGITFENVQELYVMADRYQVSELQTQCVYLIEKNLADENIGEFVNLGLRHNDRELIEAASKFLSKRAEALNDGSGS